MSNWATCKKCHSKVGKLNLRPNGECQDCKITLWKIQLKNERDGRRNNKRALAAGKANHRIAQDKIGWPRPVSKEIRVEIESNLNFFDEEIL